MGGEHLRRARGLPILMAALGLWLTSRAPAAFGGKVYESGEAALNVGVLLQPQAQLVTNGAPDGESYSTEVFVRRVRIMVFGNVTRRLSFFVETDQPNFGKESEFELAPFIQDAVLSYALVESHLWVDAGLIILPFSHNGMQSATNLTAIDYHAALILYPPGSHKVFRDGGLQLRGFLAGKRLHFRAGVWNGVRGKAGVPDPATGQSMPPLNPTDARRVAATVRFNLFGAEEGFFLGGLLFADSPVVSVGASALYQNNAVRTAGGIADHLGLAADLYADVPVGEQRELFFLGGYYRYEAGQGAPATGNGYLGELSFRWRWLGPVVSYDRFDAADGRGDLQALRVGLNFWIQKHAFNVKTEAAFTERGNGPTVTALTAQGQVLF